MVAPSRPNASQVHNHLFTLWPYASLTQRGRLSRSRDEWWLPIERVRRDAGFMPLQEALRSGSMILTGKRVLVTGGTGSMGRAFVRRVLSGALGYPDRLTIFSRDESKQHDMRVEYALRPGRADEAMSRSFQKIVSFRIGDIRSFADVVAAVRGSDIVVNAAAMKQVPACEYFPEQALLSNCIGASNIVRAIHEHRLAVETVVGVSSDKACKPVNAMGMTKALQERIFTSANVQNPATRFVAVRYGNVLASRGSVIPLFHAQIRNGGPITITDERMTRFLLSLEDAVDTIAEALIHALPGETVIPDAPSARVTDIARALLNGRKLPVQLSGTRPGEKLDEILVSEEETARTIRRGSYYVIRPELPELFNEIDVGFRRVLTKEFSSADVLLDYDSVFALLKRHRLLQDDLSMNPAAELMR